MKSTTPNYGLNGGKKSRPRNRRGGGMAERNFESVGPQVKMRGSALHLAEKYQQLARDAHLASDPVKCENYYQHAEHYFRIVASMQNADAANSQTENDEESNKAEINGTGHKNTNGFDAANAAAIDENHIVGEACEQTGPDLGRAAGQSAENGDHEKGRRRSSRGLRSRSRRPRSEEGAAHRSAPANSVSSDGGPSANQSARRGASTRRRPVAAKSSENLEQSAVKEPTVTGPTVTGPAEESKSTQGADIPAEILRDS